MKRIAQLLIFSMCIGACSSAFAQGTIEAQERFLLEQAVQNNLNFKAKERRIQQTEIERKALWQRYIPRIEADALYMYFDARMQADAQTVQIPSALLPLPPQIGGLLPPVLTFFDGESDFTTWGQAATAGITAKMLLFSGGKIPMALKAVKHKESAEHFMLRAEKEELAEEVLSTYEQYWLLEHSRLLLDESRKRLQKEQERVEKAIAAGLATPFDRNKIQVALLSLEAKEEEYARNRRLIVQKIALLTGLPEAEIPAPADSLAPCREEAQAEGSPEQRPEWQAIEARYHAYDAKLRMERLFFLPKIQAFASYRYAVVFQNDFYTDYRLNEQAPPLALHLDKFQLQPTWMVGVGMKWTLFDGMEEKHRIEKAKIDREVAAQEGEYKQQQLQLAYQKAQTDWELANKVLSIKKQSLEVSRHNLTLASRSYAQGLLSVTDWLTAEQDYARAELEYHQAIVEQRKAYRAYLRASGQSLFEAVNK
ncbi:TolC family protein [Thermonema rossianum]|uniref:TolC family protein n=1 Tax=Thermonema rossianum TaxID=55505 RepID=UPI00057094B0|nr:TolC family protein [Thermonema rossianum]